MINSLYKRKSIFNDPGTIGRGVRRAAQTDRGLSEDTVDMVTGNVGENNL